MVSTKLSGNKHTKEIIMLIKIPAQLTIVAFIGLSLLTGGCAEQSAARKPLESAKPFIAAPLKSPVLNKAAEQRLAVRPDGSITVLWWETRLTASTQYGYRPWQEIPGQAQVR